LSALQDAGCRVPETSSQLPEDATGWLLKRGGTCGGSGVWLAESEIAKNVAAGSVGECYYQQRIAGQSLSAVLVSRRPTEREASVTFLLGCTRQWLASDFSGSTETLDGSGDRPFAYCGSAGPVTIYVARCLGFRFYFGCRRSGLAGRFESANYCIGGIV